MKIVIIEQFVKLFKNSIMKIFLLYIFGLVIFFSSCVPEDNINPSSNDIRDKIEYTWNCTENSPTYGEQNYMVDIAKDPNDSTMVILSNFFGLGTWSSIKAKFQDTKLIISSEVSEGHSFTGEGVISSNYKTINWTYEVTELNKSENSKETVTAVYTR